MSYPRGGVAEIDLELTNVAGTLTDPTALVLRILPPDGTKEERTWPTGEGITKASTGKFSAIIDLDQAGEWEYRWEATGAVETASGGTLQVERDDFEDSPDRLRTFTPTVAEVAAHLRARTKDSNGNEVGTFNADTRPTDAQVRELIPKGVRRVAAKVGSEICEGNSAERQAELYEDARDLAAIATAMRIERSYFPEQIGTERSPYNALRDEYKESAEQLAVAVGEHCPGSEAEAGQSGMPVSDFPCPSGIGEVIW
jgi:hypothetical protein